MVKLKCIAIIAILCFFRKVIMWKCENILCKPKIFYLFFFLCLEIQVKAYLLKIILTIQALKPI
jgi:hypothetical protein